MSVFVCVCVSASVRVRALVRVRVCVCVCVRVKFLIFSLSSFGLYCSLYSVLSLLRSRQFQNLLIIIINHH